MSLKKRLQKLSEPEVEENPGKETTGKTESSPEEKLTRFRIQPEKRQRKGRKREKESLLYLDSITLVITCEAEKPAYRKYPEL